jgi:4-amino-4-deoxy-L-arabinose transferase-like glycosyltransferase
MAFRDASKFLLYRWRYVIGYSIIGLLLVGLLIFVGLYVPGGISPEEMRAVIRTNEVALTDPATWAVPSLPFYLLQKFIFTVFGVYDFTIKLPSLIIAFFVAIGLIMLLRRWFKPNIAVLASLIAITTGQFLFVAQNGIPGVAYMFWPVAILLLGTQVTRVKKFRFLWKILFTLAVALSLYNPLSIYPVLAIAIATVLHPHLRNIVRRLSKWKLAVCAAVFLVAITPLVYSLIRTPELGLSLLGLPTSLTLQPSVWPPDILANLQTILNQYFLFWQPSNSSLMTPVFGLGSVLLIGLGLIRMIRTRDTTRSYLIITWIICLIPILIINPRFTSVVFIPAVLLLAGGLTSLIDYWYRLFPLNPYARIAGLAPLIILVTVLIGSGLDRFVYGYQYDPNTAVNFSQNLKLLPKDTTRLVVSDEELPFYQAVASYRPSLQVYSGANGDQFVATRDAKKNYKGYEIERIITTTYAEDADRLYIYKKTAQ